MKATVSHQRASQCNGAEREADDRRVEFAKRFQ